jgi:serine/threonine protein kinase/tetratricopeptide (TPR) repeat protein
MNTNRLECVFANALAQPTPEARARYLAEACGDDADRRQQIEALLKAHDEAGMFLEPPAVASIPTSDEIPGRFIDPADLKAPGADATGLAEKVGSRIGPYKLLQLLGEGGMGAVYMAEQEEPVKRRVALKIIKVGSDSAHVLARFEAERQALAMMDHPNIARVLDAGTIGSEPRALASGSPSPVANAPGSEGRPYFVMELVKGIPITKYCDQEHLTPKERLDLFIPVCHAVQHAHQKGIIHRDIKPSNVLIALYDGKAVPKVIDFGVAKATAQKLTERTMFTEVGQIVGTLEYMAPEQAELNNLDIDTRADIYSLGVLLYELLTGSPPFTAKQLRSVAFTEMLRMIRESEPPKPSTKISSSEELPSIAAKRKLEPAKLAKLVRGDLDWIVMKCLEKDRGRRYETANGVAMDVQRYLADEPVLASPPSASYRIRKFVRKHRGPVLAAGIIVALLAAAIVGTGIGLVQAKHAEERALASADAERQAKDNETLERQKAEAAQQQAMDALRATTDEVVEKLIGAKPVLGPTEKEFLESQLKRWQTFAAQQGEGELGRHVRAEGVSRVAYLRANLGQKDEAGAGFQEAIAAYGQLAADFPAVPQYRHELATSHNSLGVLLADLGKRAEAEAAHRQALAIQDRLAADYPAVPQYRQRLAGSHNNLGNLLADLGKRAEAEAAFRQALTIQDKLAADFPAVPRYRQNLATSHNNLGVLLAGLGKPPEAETAYRLALAIQEKLAAEYPAAPQYRQELAGSHNNLGNLLAGLGKRPEAERAYRQALAIKEKLAVEYPTVPEYRKDLAISHLNLGSLLAGLGKSAEAEAAYRQALAIQDKLAAEYPVVPRYRQELATSYYNLGVLLAGLGKRPEAEAAYRQALAILEKLATDFRNVSAYPIDLGRSQLNFGELLRTNNQPEQALSWYTRAMATLEEVLRQVKVDVTAQQFLRNSYLGRAQALDTLKRHAEAVKDWDKVIELSAETERPGFRLLRAASRVRAGQVDAAIQEAEELAKNGDANTLYNVACVFALAADRKGESAAQMSKEECANRAVAILQQAVAKGWKDAEHMKKDDDLKALREREDFKKLVSELEAANAKKQ